MVQMQNSVNLYKVAVLEILRKKIKHNNLYFSATVFQDTVVISFFAFKG